MSYYYRTIRVAETNSLKLSGLSENRNQPCDFQRQCASEILETSSAMLRQDQFYDIHRTAERSVSVTQAEIVKGKTLD